MRALIALLSVVLLTGAVFGKKFSKLDIGMPRDEVIELLGRPDGVLAHGNFEALTYADRLLKGTSWNRADYVVILTGGLVSQYGPGDVRTDERTGLLVIVSP